MADVRTRGPVVGEPGRTVCLALDSRAQAVGFTSDHPLCVPRAPPERPEPMPPKIPTMPRSGLEACARDRHAVHRAAPFTSPGDRVRPRRAGSSRPRSDVRARSTSSIEMSRRRSDDLAQGRAERGAAPARRAGARDAGRSRRARTPDDEARTARRRRRRPRRRRPRPKKPRRRRPRRRRRQADGRVRRRLDVELVRRGLVPSRARAVEAIDAGRVLVGGAPASTAARQVDGGEAIALLAVEGDEYVSRGGHKLAAGLDAFAVDVEGRYARRRRSVDRRLHRLPAPTGRGARRTRSTSVVRQLAWSLREDPRVTVMERTNVRDLDRDALDPVPTSASPIFRSSRCARSRRACSRSRPTPPTSCCS